MDIHKNSALIKRILLICLSVGLVASALDIQGGGFSPKNIVVRAYTQVKNFTRSRSARTSRNGSNTGQKKVAPQKPAHKYRVLKRRNVSRLVEKRVRSSFEQARELQEENPSYLAFIGEPVRRVRRSKDMPSGRVYANKPFLTTSEQTANYMAAQNNRLFIRESRRIRNWVRELRSHLSQLEKAARDTPKPDQPIEWLAHQVSPETTILFVGEMHGFSEIREAVETLLTALHNQHSNREIILFTEFLPKGLRWKGQIIDDALALPDYTPIWEKALQNHMEVIGLEPQLVLADFCEVEGISEEGFLNVFSQWAHLEGMRLRNESWLETLQTYRAIHPDALFVVYAGAAHSTYYFPFSLATALLRTEKPFVATLYPDKVLTSNGNVFFGEPEFVRHVDILESLTKSFVFRRPVLQFQEPELAKLAGFDVRINVPIDRQRHAIENGF